MPTQWKQGVVTAIFKKGEKSLPSNYRAITLTSIICKLLEDFITEHIKHLLKTSNKNDKNQHGFTSKKSTVTNLIAALNIWTEALSHGLPVDVIYLDFEKALIKSHMNVFSSNSLNMESLVTFTPGSEITCITEHRKLESMVPTLLPLLYSVESHRALFWDQLYS